MSGASWIDRLDAQLVEASRQVNNGGPSVDQLEALERLHDDCDVVIAEYLAGSGEVEATCLNDGRPSARCRIYADGRTVEERTWS